MRDLEQLDYSGTILYSGFCEPFLHKQLDQLIILSKKYCKKARVECVTNGDLVTVEKLRWLFDAGLDTLLISMYDGPEQEGHFRELSDQAGLREEQVILRVRGPDHLSTIKNQYGFDASLMPARSNERSHTFG